MRRFLAGNNALFGEFHRRFRAACKEAGAAEYIAAKQAERAVRHRRYGDSPFVVEPNVKEGRGGLRDLQTLYWIARYVFDTQTMGELADLGGILTQQEARHGRRAWEFLWTVRFHLHYVAGRAEERLTFDMQPVVGARMGYTRHGRQDGVERFMRHYFLTAREIARLTRILEPAILRAALGPPAIEAETDEALLSAGFVLAEGKLLPIAGRDFDAEPIQMLRILQVARDRGLELHPLAVRSFIQNERRAVSLRGDPKAAAIFMDLLVRQGAGSSPARRTASRRRPMAWHPERDRISWPLFAGLGAHRRPDAVRYLPYLHRRRAHDRGGPRPQHAGARRTCRGCAGRLGTGGPRPVAARALSRDAAARHRQGPRRRSLRARRRDRAGSWAGAGSDRRRNRNGFLAGAAPPAAECHGVQARHRRSEDDPRPGRHDPVTGAAAAAADPDGRRHARGVEQSVERLEGDAAARALFARGGGAGRRAVHHRTRCACQPGEAGGGALLDDWTPEEIEHFAELGYAGYWLSFDPETHARHARLIRDAEQRKSPLTVDTQPLPARAVTEVTVYCADHAGLFSKISGALAVAGASIVDARIHTMTNGMALDTFWIQDAAGGTFDAPHRLARLSVLIEQALSGRLRLSTEIRRISKILLGRRMQAIHVPPRVVIDNHASNTHTVLEVNGRDRPGLLHDVTAAISDQGLQIASAHVTTYGVRAVDVFYVKDVFGLKVENERKLGQLREALLRALNTPDDMAPPVTVPPIRKIKRVSAG